MNALSRDRTSNCANVTIFATAAEAAEAAAHHILGKVHGNPQAVLGLATGATPKRVYATLAEACRDGRASFSGVTTFNLDEYCGLPSQHPDSYATYMHRELFSHLDLRPENINLIDGGARDLVREASRYATLLEAKGGIDLQLLGLGINGHIGFNEPGSSPESRVRVVDLAAETIAANKPTLHALDVVPARAITMGIADILGARAILVLATGAAKAQAVRRCLTEPPKPDCPGSYLSSHPNVHWLLDEGAASQLSFP